MKALIVDDDRVLADVLAFTLRREGFQVVQAFDGEMALERWSEEQPDLVVLDVNLPKVDGFSVCRRIRETADTPILLLTVRNEEDDIVHGLKLGADDYITKPFSPRQLVARAHAVLRRAGKAAAPATRQVGDLTLDTSRREIRIGRREPVSLTPLESRLLDYLMLNAGHVLTAEAIIDHVWGAEGGERDMLRQLVHRLRSKVAAACGAEDEAPELPCPEYIQTVPGLGYGVILPPDLDAGADPRRAGANG
jgi:DNA-binding response OmpR family regulator